LDIDRLRSVKGGFWQICMLAFLHDWQQLESTQQGHIPIMQISSSPSQ
jgi:hypothetical protein